MASPVNNQAPLVPSVRVSSVHSIQALIELVYVQVANSVLVGHLQALQNSLGYTKSAIDTLTILQTLHNEVAPVSKGSFVFPFSNPSLSVPGYENYYQTVASAYFGTPVSVQGQYTSGYAAFHTQMISVISQLSTEITNLSAVTPLVNGQEDPNSLVAKLHAVLKDIKSTSAGTSVTGAAKWLIDNYNNTGNTGVASSGLIQQNITNAITAGQSLNTTQTESVRNYLYLFEEYYKSATALLQQITQIIQTMAQNIK